MNDAAASISPVCAKRDKNGSAREHRRHCTGVSENVNSNEPLETLLAFRTWTTAGVPAVISCAPTAMSSAAVRRPITSIRNGDVSAKRP